MSSLSNFLYLSDQLVAVARQEVVVSKVSLIKMWSVLAQSLIKHIKEVGVVSGVTRSLVGVWSLLILISDLQYQPWVIIGT